jgi:transketolase
VNDDLGKVAREVRGTVIDLCHAAQSAHLGSSLSCVDILVAAYWGGLDLDPTTWREPDQDHLVFSKGHGAMALYATLAHRGFFAFSELKNYATDGSPFAEHPSPHGIEGVDVATGSLGHGLSLSLGMALAARIRGMRPRFLTVMSDGECNEGSVWEAALFAPAQGLDNVAVVIDYNHWQATGRSDEVMALDPLVDKWASFGWSASEIDGHDPDALRDAIRAVPNGSGRPVAYIAQTVKGRGISFMEDDNNWHYRAPTDEERLTAHRELGLR